MKIGLWLTLENMLTQGNSSYSMPLHAAKP